MMPERRGKRTEGNRRTTEMSSQLDVATAQQWGREGGAEREPGPMTHTGTVLEGPQDLHSFLSQEAAQVTVDIGTVSILNQALCSPEALPWNFPSQCPAQPIAGSGCWYNLWWQRKFSVLLDAAVRFWALNSFLFSCPWLIHPSLLCLTQREPYTHLIFKNSDFPTRQGLLL